MNKNPPYTKVSKKIAVIIGARPNFVKAAPFFKKLRERQNFECTLIHTGQHSDSNMSDVFFKTLNLPRPDFFLDIQGDHYTEKIGKMFSALQDIFKKNKFDVVVVFGDVNSTLAGALGAIKYGQELIHIESGLRSHDRRMPEEINRVIVDHISDQLFTTEPSATENLLKEGIPIEKIKYVGNIMIESLEMFWDEILKSEIVENLKLKSKGYVVATIHRNENTDNFEQLTSIFTLLNKVNKKIKIVLPLHPGTKKRIIESGLSDLIADFVTTEPLAYFDFIKLIGSSKGVITDSGGIQEETSHLGIPCATLRDNTERPITITHGSNKLFSEKKANVSDILNHLERTDFIKKNIPLWDLGVSERIFNFL